MKSPQRNSHRDKLPAGPKLSTENEVKSTDMNDGFLPPTKISETKRSGAVEDTNSLIFS